MVKPKVELLKWAISNSKMRIAHHEKAGNGSVAMEDKRILKRQERQLQLLLEKINALRS